MREYSGMLHELGPSTDAGIYRHYSYIKIGDQLLKNVSTDSKFDTVLRSEYGKYPKLWMLKRFGRYQIIGISQENGQTFRQGVSRHVAWIFFMLVLMSVFFINADGSGLEGVFHLLTAFSGFAMLLHLILLVKIMGIDADHVF